MLQLIKMEEKMVDEIYNPQFGWNFLLTFLDKKLPEQAWPLIEKELINYGDQVNGIIIKSEVIALESGHYINLFIEYPKTDNRMTNEEIDNTLERLKINFQEHYESLIERIQLVPIFA